MCIDVLTASQGHDFKSLLSGGFGRTNPSSSRLVRQGGLARTYSGLMTGGKPILDSGEGERLSTLKSSSRLTASYEHRMKPPLSGSFKTSCSSSPLGWSTKLACKRTAGKRTNGERAV